jgi:hypothetical protein
MRDGDGPILLVDSQDKALRTEMAGAGTRQNAKEENNPTAT